MQSNELLRSTLNEWASLYNKKMLDAEAEIWMRIFRNTPPKVLALALDHLTKNAERMPAPGHLTKAISLTYERHPELLSKTNLSFREGVDANGVKCIFWSDGPNVPAYRAVDCKEGRAFLALLARTSGKTPDQCAALMEKYVTAPAG